MNPDVRCDKILLIENDYILARILKIKFNSHGLHTTFVKNNQLGLKEALSNKYALLIIDFYLPDINGLNITKQVRKQGIKIPILLISNKNTALETKAFQEGITLFHSKPLKFNLLNLQVFSLLKTFGPPKKICYKDLIFHPQNKSCYYKNSPLKLSKQEYYILLALVRSAGRVLSRQELLNQNIRYNKDVTESSIDTIICRIRKKLRPKKGQSPFLPIETVPQFGYRIAF